MKRICLVLFLLPVFWGISNAQTATFTFTTSGTTPEIETAIEYTGNIWSQYLQSEVPIKVHVAFIPVPGFLGVSLSNARKDFPGAPKSDIWYPASLANAISQTELNPGETDMEIYIGGTANWYFGTDGNPGPGQYDFVSVLLHEIGHSIGMISLCNKVGDLGTLGRITPADIGIIPTTFTFEDLEGKPGIFDYFIINGAGNKLMDTLLFPNNSAALGDQLTSDNLFFNGDSARAAYNGAPPKLYAPSAFDIGSSCTHLNEATYSGTPDGLMTPFTSTQEINQEPGPIMLGVLYDIGWNQGPSSTSNPSSGFQINIHPNPFHAEISVDYYLERPGKVQLQVLNQLGQVLKTITKNHQSSGFHRQIWQGEDLPNGLYFQQLTIDQQIITIPLLKNY